MRTAAPPATEFFVRGKPVAKGSMIVRHRHGRITAGTQRCDCKNWMTAVSDAKLTEWEALIATAAKRAMGQHMPFAGAVLVTMTFYFPRYKFHLKDPSPPRYVITRGHNDSDKLTRAVFDALTLAAVWQDDSQGMLGGVLKIYCDQGEVPGVVVKLEEL